MASSLTESSISNEVGGRPVSINQNGFSLVEVKGLLPLQLQALEIIDEILAGTDPSEETARTSLKWHVRQHPGQPERALLMHMMALPRSDH